MSNIIKIGDAKKWTAKWQSETKSQNHCKAFLVPVNDLLGALSEMGVISMDSRGNITGSYSSTQAEKVRAYMAIDESIITGIESKYPPGTTRDQALKDAGWGEKLLIVGTEKTSKISQGNIIYQDIVEDETDGGGGTARYSSGVTLNGSGVYDFTNPCPNDCDPNSPLNH